MFDLNFLCDSLETAVTWSRCMSLINAIKETWNIEVEKRNLKHGLFFRISQIYDNGVCVYFYYGIGPTKDRDQFEVFDELTELLRKTIKEAGGSVSHHHGIGKKNKNWYASAVSEVGVEVMKSIKTHIDPINVFGVGNMIDIKENIDKIESKL
jgi:alkyldihydroxyacetonephosphate synthase